MNIASLFARSYVDAFRVATGPFSAETPVARTAWAEARRPATAAASLAAKKFKAAREALDARW